MKIFLASLDLAGTFVFAISGATVGVRQRLDLFGVLVLSIAAATAGGIMRDVLIGDVPPAALLDWRYLGTACLAGLIVFYRYSLVERFHHPVQIFDAAGLALFAVTGAWKALSFELAPVTAILLGMLTGIGGGMVRDILVAQIPVVLRAELYAVAALAGAAAVVIGDSLGWPQAPVLIAGALLSFGLRFVVSRFDWRLPIAGHREQ